MRVEDPITGLAINLIDEFVAEKAEAKDSMGADDIATGVLNYLRTMNQMKRDFYMRSVGDFHYLGMEDFLLQHGRFWTPATLPSHIPQMTPKMCFENCFKLASRRKNLRYVEGIAMGVIPIHHAWVVDEDNNVIDPTWASIKDGSPAIGSAYFGVTFPLTLVRRIRSRRCLSVLDNWISGQEIYKQPFTAE